MARALAFVIFWVLGQLANFVASIRMFWALATGSSQATRIAISFDQLGNAALNGNEDETISSRAGRARDKGKRWGCVLCKILDWMFRGPHCTDSIERQFIAKNTYRLWRERRVKKG